MAFLGYIVGGKIGTEYEWCSEPGLKEKSDGTGYELNTPARVGIIAFAADPIIFVTSLVIGLLGLLSVIHGMPPAASYALIGYAGFISLTWIVNIAWPKSREHAFGFPKSLAQFLLKNPE
jgi:hypothetical protein